MPYVAEISRANPSCILFVIDQSASMEDPFGGDPTRRKSEGVAAAINRLLHTIVLRCAATDGVKHAYDLGVIGYGREICFGFGGAAAGRELVPIPEVADSPARIEERTAKVEDGCGGLVTQTKRVPIWFEPRADGPTPMAGALEQAHRILAAWLPTHPDAFPPIVVNITDGDATDGDPLPKALALQQLATSDGSVLLFNCHISDRKAAPLEFPSNEQELPPGDNFAKLLFRMSSVLPSKFRETAASEGHKIAAQSRGFVFNADLVQLIEFLDIGTRASNLR